MKRIYIYFPEDGEEYSGGAKTELSDTVNGNVYAFVSSSEIDEIWHGFQRRLARHGIKENAVTGLMADLALTLFENRHVPFRCLRRLNDTEWDCTERCIVGTVTAQEVMR